MGSVINIINFLGPETVPWGTPPLLFPMDDTVLPIVIIVAYVRSQQNVRDEVGPLDDNAGNVITHGILTAEELNMHLRSLST